MKRALFVAFALCSLCLLINTATVIAFYAGYIHTTYSIQNPVTLDAKWTSTTEWTDTLATSFGGASSCVFRSKWGMSEDGSIVYQYIIIEILNDNTNDTGDYWELCFDGDASGGAAPQAGVVASDSMDIKIDIVGHNSMTQYYGTGTGWTQVSAPTTFQWNNSISTSPTSGTPHWICEIIIEKINFGIGPEYWMRIAYFDASNAAAGVQAWPPTSPNVPSDWGDIPYVFGAIPEGLSFAVVVLLSSVAVIVGSIYLRKRPKTTNLTPTKL